MHDIVKIATGKLTISCHFSQSERKNLTQIENFSLFRPSGIFSLTQILGQNNPCCIIHGQANMAEMKG